MFNMYTKTKNNPGLQNHRSKFSNLEWNETEDFLSNCGSIGKNLF